MRVNRACCLLLCISACTVLVQGFFHINIDKKNLRLPNIPIPVISLNVPDINQIMRLFGKGGGGHGGGGWSWPSAWPAPSSGWGGWESWGSGGGGGGGGGGGYGGGSGW